jgi:hypothetical protein
VLLLGGRHPSNSEYCASPWTIEPYAIRHTTATTESKCSISWETSSYTRLPRTGHAFSVEGDKVARPIFKNEDGTADEQAQKQMIKLPRTGNVEEESLVKRRFQVKLASARTMVCFRPIEELAVLYFT